MPKSWLSLRGLLLADSTVLDAMNLPDGIDRETLTNSLVLECSELEVVFPNPDFFKKAVAAWSAVRLREWSKLYASELLEYDPIFNYDRYETYTDKEKETTKTATGGEDNNISQVSAFNSEDFQNRTKNTAAYGGTASGETGRSFEHTARMYGNIGVTTSQQMLEAERSVVRFSTYDVIVQEFKEKFCIQVY